MAEDEEISEASTLLPEDLDLCRVTGRWVTTAGMPVRGSVRFVPLANRLVSPATATVVLPHPVVANLNEVGEIDIEIPATDDPDISPVGWTWEVTEEFPRGQRYTIEAPAEGHIDLSEVVEAEPSTGTTIVRGPKGDPGPPGDFDPTQDLELDKGLVVGEDLAAGGDASIAGDLTVGGVPTFQARSPRVPNPAEPGVPEAAVSRDEVEQMIAAQPVPGDRLIVTGGVVDVAPSVPMVRSIGVRPFTPVRDTTIETDLTTGVTVPAAEMSAGSSLILTAGGYAANQTGDAATLTLRLRAHDGMSDRVLSAWPVELPDDPEDIRPWRLSATITPFEFVGLRPITAAEWVLGPGDTAPREEHISLVSTEVVQADVPVTWRLTAQWSVAAQSASIYCTVGSLTTAIPEGT